MQQAIVVMILSVVLTCDKVATQITSIPVTLAVTSDNHCLDGFDIVIEGQNFTLNCSYGYPEGSILSLKFYRGINEIIYSTSSGVFESPFDGRSSISYDATASFVEIIAQFNEDNNDNNTYSCAVDISDNGVKRGSSENEHISICTTLTEEQLKNLVVGAENETTDIENLPATITVRAVLPEDCDCKPASLAVTAEDDTTLCTGVTTETQTVCEFILNSCSVGEVKQYMARVNWFGVEATKYFTQSCTEPTPMSGDSTTTADDCNCCRWAFGVFLGPTVIVPICHIISMTIIILILTGVICATCACIVKCSKKDRLFQVKLQSVIHIVIIAFESACTIAVGVCFGWNTDQDDSCNCDDGLYLVVVPPIMVTLHIIVVVVAIIVVPKKIPESSGTPPVAGKRENLKPKDERTTSKIRHRDLPEGVAVRDPITPRKLPPIGQTYD